MLLKISLDPETIRSFNRERGEVVVEVGRFSKPPIFLSTFRDVGKKVLDVRTLTANVNSGILRLKKYD